jgi:siroheme synthase
VIVSQATMPQQQVRWSSLSRLSREEKLPAPALLIIGRVAAQKIAELSASFWRGEIQQNRLNPRVAS